MARFFASSARDLSTLVQEGGFLQGALYLLCFFSVKFRAAGRRGLLQLIENFIGKYSHNIRSLSSLRREPAHAVTSYLGTETFCSWKIY
jgi:DNA-binding NtrC family response regulator